MNGIDSITYSEGQFSPARVGLLQYWEQLEEGELALVVIHTEVLPLALHRGQSAHGHTSDVVVGKQLPQSLTLLTGEIQTDILKCSFL